MTPDRIGPSPDGQTSETDCCIVLNGQQFSNNEAFIGLDTKTGKLKGHLYRFTQNPTGLYQITTDVIGTWDGNITTRVQAHGTTYRSNFGDKRQSLYFFWFGTPMMGTHYGMEWSNTVQCREIKRKSMPF